MGLLDGKVAAISPAQKDTAGQLGSNVVPIHCDVWRGADVEATTASSAAQVTSWPSSPLCGLDRAGDYHVGAPIALIRATSLEPRSGGERGLPMGRLDGKVALITGTGGGQGRAAAEVFAREGAKIFGADLKVEGNKETKRLVESAGGTMTSMEPVDLSDAKQAEAFVEAAVAEWGGVDILYNNASAQNFVPFGDITLDEWSFTMKNDLELVFLVTRFAWKHLVARGGGSIINTASGAGITATRSTPTVAHSTAKAGVMGFTRALAAEAAVHHIRVNCIAPGLIETPVSAEILASEVGQELARGIPMGRIGKPEDIAYFALYLASDESTYVTGTTFAIDGGTTTILP